MIIYGYIVFARLDICVQWCAHICCVVVRMCAHWNMYLLVQITSGDKQVRRERKGGRERERDREKSEKSRDVGAIISPGSGPYMTIQGSP